MIIAIDGPSGSGKSSISKQIAKKLNILHLDTGAMYRTFALYLLENNMKLSDEAFKNFKFEQKGNNFYLNGKDVTKKIRENEISKKASDISKNLKVREYMVNEQREIAKGLDVILDGRDITTVVFPNADFKFFITASIEKRAYRRYLEDKSIPYQKILEDIRKRDEQDSKRKNSPLKIASDAVVIDTSEYTKEEVIERVLNIIKGKKNEMYRSY